MNSILSEKKLIELGGRIVEDILNYSSMDFNPAEQEEHDQRAQEVADRIRPYLQAANNEIIRLNGLLRVAQTERWDMTKAFRDR